MATKFSSGSGSGLTAAQKQNNYWQNIAAWYAASKKPGGDGVGGASVVPAKTAGAVAPAPAPYNPFASIDFQTGQNIANQQYGTTVSGIHNRENMEALNSGFTLSRDANDNVTGSSVDYNTIDTTNPFSRAALLKRSYDQNKARDTNSYAAQGQLFSGALQNQRGNTQFGFEQGQDSLQKSMAEFLLNASQGRAQAGTDRDTTTLQSLLAALSNAPTPG